MKATKATEGFLVVLMTPETLELMSNKRYRGVNRIPCYRLANQDPINEEIEGMERYVFGGVRDEGSGLIPSQVVALHLLAQLQNSPRKFELLWCRVVPVAQDAQTTAPDLLGQRLGFDLAGLGGDFWSIVADFPFTDNRFASFAGKLNENGLFDAAADARAYLNEYQRLQLPDFDIPFEVLEVQRVESQKGRGETQ